MKRVLYFCMTLTLTLCIVLASCPFKSFASAVSIPFDIPSLSSPVPLSPSDVFDAYDSLNDEQKQALDFIFASDATLYGAQRGITVDSVSSGLDWLLSLGERLTEFLNPVSWISKGEALLQGNSSLRRKLSSFIDYVQLNVTSTFLDWYESNVLTAQFGLVYNSDSAQAYTDLIGSANVDAIDLWQTSTFQLSYHAPSLPSEYVSLFPSAVKSEIATFVRPLYFWNKQYDSNWQVYIFDGAELELQSAFIDTSNPNNYCRLVDSVGRVFGIDRDNIIRLNGIYLSYYYTYSVSSFQLDAPLEFVCSPVQWDGSSIPTGYCYVTYEGRYGYQWASSVPSGVDGLPYVIGSSFATSVPYTTTSTLGLSMPISKTVVRVPSTDVAISVQDVISALEGDTDELSVVDYLDANAISLDGSAVTWSRIASAVSAIESNLLQGSGLSISPSFFSGFTSYIQYLWSFAEPLVLYTRDLLVCLTFDGQGIAWIFFGVCSLGVIGGVVYKFLQ